MVRYSQEMTNLVYFKIWKAAPVITRLQGRRYHRTYGIVLSSFRVVEVLIPLNHEGRIPLKYGKYVYFTKCSNQRTIVRKMHKVCEIHDSECLESVTGKKDTIPDRLYIRLETWEDPKYYARWSSIPYLLKGGYQQHALYLLVLYYGKARKVGRYGLDMDLVYIPPSCALRFTKIGQNLFIDGICYPYGSYIVFINFPYVGFTYDKLMRVVKSSRSCWHAKNVKPPSNTLFELT